MTDKTENGRDWSQTLNLPKTEFPMRAGLPKKEPEILAKWDEMDLYGELRKQSKGREKFVLHDGPPYANGNLHIGHALNKTLKDIITKSFQMRGYDSNYVPGWDCHGLPIEWKIEEQYRAKGKNKDEVPINEFRSECRDFAAHWVGVQTDEFKRLGVVGDFKNPYLTMAYEAEAIIADELMKFAKSGQLYRGSKPIMWSVVERTALAEAEIEYHEHQSDTIWVKFPVVGTSWDHMLRHDTSGKPYLESEDGDSLEWLAQESGNLTAAEELRKEAENFDQLKSASVVIWTTTPWTIPGNRAVCFSSKISYGLYEVTAAEIDFGPQPGEKLIFADSLAAKCFEKAKLEFKRLREVSSHELGAVSLAHPLSGFGGGYNFPIPMLEGDHVTDDAGTGFVHTAPGHGRDDFEIWMASKLEQHQFYFELDGKWAAQKLADARKQRLERKIESAIPFTVDDGGFYTEDAPGFGPSAEGGAARVLDDKGKKGDANDRVIKALIEKDALFARGRLKHEYPHSWRSKKPIIFRNTPQWFVYMDKDSVVGDGAQSNMGTLRQTALAAIDETRFVPERGQTRLRGMIEDRPDWVLSRQRAWGVPITVFRHVETGQVIPGPDFERSDELSARIKDAFAKEGADAWYAEGAKERFLDGFVDNMENWEKVDDILDVWFDSGSTHAFCLQQREDLKWPADVYLEGSDQHRGWFHSSLLESCGTRGRAPYNTVITHGFTMAEDGRKMSKSLNNQVFPQDIIKESGADILRLWVASTDYQEDQRIGKEILKTNIDAYRKLRNTLRWMLGTLAHDKGETVAIADMPELERLMLHRLAELDAVVNEGYDNFDFKRIFSQLFNFMTVELSAFYFDIRKDALYCDAPSSVRRKAALQVVGLLFDHLVKWLAPIMPFTMEEAWLDRHPESKSVHMEQFSKADPDWLDAELAAKWQKIRKVRRVVTGALEIERMEKRVRSSLEAAPLVHIVDADLFDLINGLSDFEDICITSSISVEKGDGPADAFRMDDIPGVAVVPTLAEGNKCARSWRILPEVGSDPEFPELSLRDAAAIREIEGQA